MSWIVGYANICTLIKDKELRSRTFMNAANGIYGNIENLYNNVCNWYYEEENWMQILDVYLQLDKKHRKVLVKLFNKRRSVFAQLSIKEVIRKPRTLFNKLGLFVKKDGK